MAEVSFTSWDTMTLVSFRLSFSLRISWTSTPMVIGSCPVNGSSYRIIMGSSAMARASATRRPMPPESSRGIRPWAPRSPTASSFISTRWRIIDSGRSVCSRSGKATLSKTERSVSSAPLWNSIPMRLRS